jgi:hypothetical protein
VAARTFALRRRCIPSTGVKPDQSWQFEEINVGLLRRHSMSSRGWGYWVMRHHASNAPSSPYTVECCK